MQQGTTLVLGGRGKTGRRVVERLVARGVATRVGSRSGEPPFDWEDRSTWAPALDGVASPTSPTTRTSRLRALSRRSARSRSWP
jgi:nucleoside-diphosphate-sugar epimerase